MPLFRVEAALDADDAVPPAAVLEIADCDVVVDAVVDAVVVLALPAAWAAAASFIFSFLIRSSRCFARTIGFSGLS